jgi:nucleoside-diphosphate-sugar epimerase
MSPSTPLKILVLLSTGKQGTAVVSQLSASTTPHFEVLAVTRNAQSDAAKRLNSLPNVSVIQGSTATPTSTDDLFAKAGPLDGLVIIQLDADEHPGGFEGEIEEGKRIIDTAKRHGVKHIVYHGMDLPPTFKQPVQVYVKPKIEVPDYLAQESNGGKAYTWTALRPCNFFENFIGMSGLYDLS